MAIRNASGKIPEGAVALQRHEVVDHQWQLIHSWPIFRDIWPFKIGLHTIAIAGSISSLTINHHFRRKLKLNNFGLVTSNLAIGVTPSLFIAGSHAMLVTHDIFLNETRCPLCLQQRAAFLQVGFSVCFPLVMSPLANFMFATRHGTYRLPYFSDWRETINLWLRMVKPARRKLAGLILFEIITAGFITYCEQKSLLDFRMKMIKLEDEIEEEKRQLRNSH